MFGEAKGVPIREKKC